jgi:hypothetical protein
MVTRTPFDISWEQAKCILPRRTLMDPLSWAAADGLSLREGGKIVTPDMMVEGPHYNGREQTNTTACLSCHLSMMESTPVSLEYWPNAIGLLESEMDLSQSQGCCPGQCWPIHPEIRIGDHYWRTTYARACLVFSSKAANQYYQLASGPS